ncbi:MAG: PilZ domain-containing protein [Candidatus Ancaeobacter aquaticus]|nr:PilZ domain-containing protein [Candidatus Ancaeobacter aquaticus]
MNDMSFSGIEKRKYVRIPFSFVIKYKTKEIKKGHSNFLGATYSKDISAGGLLFPASGKIPIGSEVDIELNISAVPSMHVAHILAHFSSVSITGRVVRCEEVINGELYNIGVVIEKIEEKDRTALEQFIQFFLRRERLRNKFKFGVAGREYIGPERRRYARVPYTFIVKYTPLDERQKENGQVRYCINTSISACGILLETHEKYDVGAFINVEIVVPSDKEALPIKIVGRVVRTEEIVEQELYDVGIAFDKIEKKDQASILNFLNCLHFRKER